MPLFTWDSSYSVGVQDMDNEHIKLFGIINSLYDAMKSGKSKEVMEDVFKQLVDYTEVHFSDEEKLMSQHNYPGINEQMAQHKLFVDKVEENYKKYREGAILISIDIMNFLKDWLVNHIQIIDKKYAEFFNRIGIK
jgi:hemerythrin-like metal-binding protein